MMADQGWSQTAPDRRLVQRTSVKLEQTPLKMALEELCTRHNLQLKLDEQGLAVEDSGDDDLEA